MLRKKIQKSCGLESARKKLVRLFNSCLMFGVFLTENERLSLEKDLKKYSEH